MSGQFELLYLIWPVPNRHLKELLLMAFEEIIIVVPADLKEYVVVFLLSDLWLRLIKCLDFQCIEDIRIANNKASDIANLLSIINNDQQVGVQGSLLILWLY